MDETDVANLALSALSHHQINSYGGDQTSLGKTIRRFYPIARREVLASYNWKFSFKVVKLTCAKVVGVAKPYSTPIDILADSVRLVSVHAAEDEEGNALEYGDDNEIRWEIGAGNAINVDYPVVWVRYIADNETIDEWPPRFLSAVAYRLAYHITLPVTKSVRAKAAMLEAYMDSVSQAKANDIWTSSSQTYDPHSQVPSLIQARESGLF